MICHIPFKQLLPKPSTSRIACCTAVFASHIILELDDRSSHRKRGPNYSILLPLIYAPLLPLSTPLVLSLVFTPETLPCRTATLYGCSHVLLLSTCVCAVRIGLKNRVAPATRDKIFGAAVLTALAHAGYVSPLYLLAFTQHHGCPPYIALIGNFL